MRIRLKESCQMFGRIYAAGEEVIVPDGFKGPHRAARKSHDKISYDPSNGLDANRILGEMEDVPLYDVVEEKANDAETQPAEVRAETHIEERERR